MTVLGRKEQPQKRYDVIIMGAGPVGLACALESAREGRHVLLVEAGGSDAGILDVSTNDTQVADPERHAPIELTTRSGIGGTSWLWGGRCVAFEPIDFEPRDYVPGSDWPIGLADVAPYFGRAADHLDCGAAQFRSTETDWDGLSQFTMSNLERWARRPKLGPGLGARVAAHARIDVLLQACVTDVEFDETRTVTAVSASRDGDVLKLRATDYILAMGGLEITRLLLRLQRRMPDAFGGVDGPLGRYYMGHATGSIADIVLDDPARAADLDFVLDAHDTYIRRRFTLTEAAQRENEVLNTSFYLDNPPFYEVEHRNPTLSAVFLGIAFPPVGRRILAEGIRLRHVGPKPYRIAAHVGNIARRPFRAAADVIDILRHRYLSNVRKPGFILRNVSGRYAIHYHGEQVPNPDSRMTLIVESDGQEVLKLDYRYVDQDVDSLLRAHELLDAELRAAGVAHLEYLRDNPVEVRAFAWEQTTDGFHSIGTTRMSVDAERGVVDADCRVHGTSNLHIASSSVFPTSAEANPTFFAVALSVRLAHHLAEASRQRESGLVQAGDDSLW
ncbi:GMC oxidoreductase [Microbacterium memoriense]|uniref:GMC oxidoreductase n=1 Tax=Microbacterium memoriense TaxID=2978350 RepID=A0ABT2PDN6_9MICO|nr:GMC oxidoreductase [Microbacterium memoriense]MCT9002621.1 GMC oxidoreductase [Microbacterium memoriense]